MRNIRTRVEALERRLLPKIRSGPYLILVLHPLDHNRSIQAGERVVKDIYRDTNGVAYARERITTDADDQGSQCAPGGFLLPIIEELHQTCEFRLRSGGCGDCTGTPICPE